MFVEGIKKHWLRYSLAFLWIFNGVLQFQPKLQSSQFIYSVIRPIYVGQVGLYETIENIFIKIFLENPHFFGLLIGLIQISIGVLIIIKKLSKRGLQLSVIWGLFVWIFGQDVGGLLSGNYNFMMGSPGSVIIYVAIAGYLLKNFNQTSDQPDSSFLVVTWIGLWLSASLSLILSFSSLSMMFTGTGNKALPAWISLIANFYQQQINQLGVMSIYILFFLFLFTAIAVLLNRFVKNIFLVIGSFIAIIFWIVAQQAGQYYSGLMTDLNTGPLIVILAIAIFQSKFISFFNLAKKIEVFLT